MSDLGNLLRQGREAKSLTLAQAESDTRVRRAYLEALEGGHWEQLPDTVYTRGLVVSYARYLGLDEVEVRRLLGSELGAQLSSLQGFNSYQPLSEPLQVKQRRWLRIMLGLALLVAAAVLVWWNWPWVVLWGKWFLAGAPMRPQVIATRTPTQATLAIIIASRTTPEMTIEEPTAILPSPTSAALPLPTPAPPPTDTPAVVPTVTPTLIVGLLTRVEATGTAWIRVVVDGNVAFEGTLNAGESQEWLGATSVSLLTGNAGGTRVIVNGQDVGSLGANGEVIERRWIWQDNQVVAATPEG
ncbi:MAG: helix-turn-helix domain-containing protein [Anaerolineae bacterium]